MRLKTCHSKSSLRVKCEILQSLPPKSGHRYRIVLKNYRKCRVTCEKRSAYIWVADMGFQVPLCRALSGPSNPSNDTLMNTRLSRSLEVFPASSSMKSDDHANSLDRIRNIRHKFRAMDYSSLERMKPQGNEFRYFLSPIAFLGF